MAPKKIVVFGVTGVQGGSVARALLEEPDKFEVHGVSRSKTSKKAQGESERSEGCRRQWRPAVVFVHR